MSTCTYCHAPYPPSSPNPLGRCGDCGTDLIFLAEDRGSTYLEVTGDEAGTEVSIRVHCQQGLIDRVQAMRLRDELDAWIAATTEYGRGAA